MEHLNIGLPSGIDLKGTLSLQFNFLGGIEVVFKDQFHVGPQVGVKKIPAFRPLL